MVEDFLSEYGKKVFIPKGFTTQSEEANGKVDINATAGVYQVNNRIKGLSTISRQFNLTEEDVIQYVPASGYKPLREEWHKKIGNVGSLPVVTNGISNALYVAGSLFIDKDDEVFIPELHWDAYDSIFGLRLGAQLITYDNFNSKAIEIAVKKDNRSEYDENKLEENAKEWEKDNRKKIIVLNYPNNPTGYTPQKKVVDDIFDVIEDIAYHGNKVVVIVDDAYFGFFYQDTCYKKSFFDRLSKLHNNVLAVKCDGASKELCAWGMRVGFITFGSKCIKEKDKLVYSLLEHKAAAVNRGTLSSVSMDNQVAIYKALTDSQSNTEIYQVCSDLQERYEILRKSISEAYTKYGSGILSLLPCNSGYFVCFRSKVDAEKLRQNLLKKKIGVIRYNSNYIRIAFSSVDKDKIPYLIDTLYEESDKLSRDPSIDFL